MFNMIASKIKRLKYACYNDVGGGKPFTNAVLDLRELSFSR